MQEVIGREAELAATARFLDAMREGPAGLVLDGEAGIGKTTLWNAAVEAAGARSYQVLAARGAKAESRLSFAACADLLTPVAQEAMAALPVPQRRALEVALLLMEPGVPPPRRRVVSAGFVSAIATLARRAPVLVAVDDVQWLDRRSARVLEFAVRRLHTRPVGILASARVPDQTAVPLGLDRALAEDRLIRLQLGPLSLGAIHQLLRSRLDVVFPRRILVKLEQASGGNPFFALELARALLRRGGSALQDGALPVPHNLRDLVRDRLFHVSDDARQLLLLAAGLLQPSTALLREAAGDGEAVTAALQEVLSAGIVAIEGGRIRFIHPLLASTLYSDSSARQRRDLHRRLAGVVADPEERARHLALGADGPDPGIASALDQAAARARARGAPAAAAGLAGLARQLTPAESVGDLRSRAVAQADHLFDGGDVLGARTLLEEVVASTPSGPARAEALRRLGRAHYHTGTGQAALQCTEQALCEAGADPVLRARIEVDLAAVAGTYGDQSSALAHARSAVDLAEDAGDVPTLAEALALDALYGCFAGLQDHHERIHRALALEEADRGDCIRPYLSPTYISAYLLVWADRLDEARSRLEVLRARMLDRGDESAFPALLFLLSELECLAGRWAEAARHAEEGCAVALANGQQLYLALTTSAKALVLAHLGRVAEARATAEEGLAIGLRLGAPPAVSMNLRALGFLELSLGDPAATHRHLRAAARSLAAAGVTEPGTARFLPDEIEAMVAVGELQEAAALLGPFEERARALGRAWALATGARCRGLLRAAEGDLCGAASALEEALREHERLPLPFELGRTLLVKGGIHRRRREKGAARDALLRAQQVFEDLGAPLWAQRAAAELRRVGLRPRAPLELTATEERVAALAASGLTNREVARGLFISPKTVEANLVRVYRKLGIRSRAELGARMAAGGPRRAP